MAASTFEAGSMDLDRAPQFVALPSLVTKCLMRHQLGLEFVSNRAKFARLHRGISDHDGSTKRKDAIPPASTRQGTANWSWPADFPCPAPSCTYQPFKKLLHRARESSRPDRLPCLNPLKDSMAEQNDDAGSQNLSRLLEKARQTFSDDGESHGQSDCETDTDLTGTRCFGRYAS